MTNLKNLSTSLTKHGAHKIAILLKYFGSEKILDHLENSIEDVNIERVQAKKNLSAQGGAVPVLWDKARTLGQDAIDSLVLLGIIFSHRDLIYAMRKSSDPNIKFAGTIIRNTHLDGKAFTNFSHTIEQLGYSTAHSQHQVRYDLKHLFFINGLSSLAIDLLILKIKTAGWDGKNSYIDEFISLGFHEVLSIDEVLFRNWLSTGSLAESALAEGALTVSTENERSDLSFFFSGNDAKMEKGFFFVSGHNVRKTGKVKVALGNGVTSAELLHNAMQNKLYKRLVNIYGDECVGTEISSGAGTFIDVVVKTKEKCNFYEIKTAESVKVCIRQAIPQLLEYAYWYGDVEPVSSLIIVGPVKITKEASKYLAKLRKEFGVPVYYEHIDVEREAAAPMSTEG